MSLLQHGNVCVCVLKLWMQNTGAGLIALMCSLKEAMIYAAPIVVGYNRSTQNGKEREKKQRNASIVAIFIDVHQSISNVVRNIYDRLMKPIFVIILHYMHTSDHI